MTLAKSQQESDEIWTMRKVRMSILWNQTNAERTETP